MPKRRASTARRSTTSETKLARLRLGAGISQRKMAEMIGISLGSYRELELDRMRNPPLRYLTNAAMVLGVKLEDVVEDEWRRWFVFSVRSPRPPTLDSDRTA